MSNKIKAVIKKISQQRKAHDWMDSQGILPEL
jgi:hypothetical protein